MTHLDFAILGSSLAARANWAILAPIILIEALLLIYCLVDVIRRETVAGGNKLVWVAVIILLGTLGQIVYLVIGRGEN
jgi:branched-subunit amino acid transport protein AzlD